MQLKYIKDALKAKQIDDILQFVADGDDYFTEYDGRIYRHCRFCDNDLDKYVCDDRCPTTIARAILGDKWEALNKSTVEDSSHIRCPNCNKKVFYLGMKSHQLNNEKCMKKQIEKQVKLYNTYMDERMVVTEQELLIGGTLITTGGSLHLLTRIKAINKENGLTSLEESI